MLRERGVDISLILPSPCPKNLSWLPGAEHIATWRKGEIAKQEQGDEAAQQRGNDATGLQAIIDNAKVIVVLDLNSLDRLDDLGKAITYTSN